MTHCTSLRYNINRIGGVAMGLKLKKKIDLNAQKEVLSKRGKKSRRKGASYERDIAHIFQEFTGYDFVRTPQSGGFMKKSDKAEDFRGDILPADKSVRLKLHIEAKNQEKWNLKSWLSQAQEDCPEGRIPVVIMKKANTNKAGQKGNQQNLVVIDLDDFLKLVDVDKVVEKRDIQ